MLIIASDYDAGLWEVFVGRHPALDPEEQAAVAMCEFGKRNVCNADNEGLQ
jgi:hypothetical protein